MDKVMTLCYDCQELVKDSYKLEVWPNVKRAPRCEMCGKETSKYAGDVCHVTSKERG